MCNDLIPEVASSSSCLPKDVRVKKARGRGYCYTTFFVPHKMTISTVKGVSRYLSQLVVSRTPTLPPPPRIEEQMLPSAYFKDVIKILVLFVNR
ncbi:hypothetical protein TNCV_28761 [Trichonephila clavipes]|uniref:Uncharacterized protein n=1 Tax=Trichonephila clavipes TaxID=2585209 RepID=A0A8X6WLG8_TRICX|nr:hypothetical protein TNCV_28761 [Trichonephila clavipes]